MEQQASPSPGAMPERLLEPRKVLIALLLGSLGFLGSFCSFNFSVPPLTLAILWSYTFPLIAGMAYGGRYGFIAGLFGWGALYPFFLWPSNGWASAVTAGLILLWFTWHGYCAGRREHQPAFWNHPFVAQVLFAIVYAAGTRYGYPVAMAANPPPWAPEAFTSLPVEVLNSLVAKGTLNLFLAFFAAICALISPEIRRPLRLSTPAYARANGKIVLGSLLTALGMWGILLLSNSLFIEHTFPTDIFTLNTPYEIIALVMFIASGLIAGYIIARYMEMHEKANAALRASETRYRSTFEQAAIGIANTSVSGRFLHVNNRLCEITGYSREALLSMSFQDLTHPDDLPLDLELSRRLLAGEIETFQREKRYVHRSGKTVWVSLTASLVRDESGAPAYFISFVEDITARKQVEEALAQQRILLRTVIEHLPDAVYVKDLKMRKILANRADLANIGLTDEAEVLGKTDFELFPPEIAEKFMRDDQAVLTSGLPIFQREERLMNHNGEERWLLTSKVPLRDDQGQIIGIVGIGHDITARKKNEAALLESNAQLRAALTELQETQRRLVQQERLAAVGQLAAGIAHDFNNILAVIILYAQGALQTPALPEPVIKRLEVILNQAQQAASLIQQILDFGGRAVLERQLLNLQLFLEEQYQLLRRTLPENIHITLEIATAPHEYIVHADPTRLQQVLFNLAVNARDAMPQGGTLHLELAYLEIHEPQVEPPLTPGPWIRLTVADTGTGMAPEALAHLFEPFFTTKVSGRGSGLGLAQVHGIIKQHQGHITVTSRPGEGTAIALYLPAHSVAVAADSPTCPEALEQGHGERILVVEDNPLVRMALVNLLELLHYEPVEAAHGDEALKILQQHADSIALVLSDWVMPEMGGQELLKALRERGYSQPFIVLSGYPLEQDLGQLYALGLYEWLGKPIKIEVLAQALAQALRPRETASAASPDRRSHAPASPHS